MSRSPSQDFIVSWEILVVSYYFCIEYIKLQLKVWHKYFMSIIEYMYFHMLKMYAYAITNN